MGEWDTDIQDFLIVGQFPGSHLLITDSSQIPAVLKAAYSGEIDFSFAEIWYYTDGVSFYYEALGFNNFFGLSEYVTGTYDITNGVIPLEFIDGPGAGGTPGAMHIGSDRYSPSAGRPSLNFRTADFQVEDTGTCVIQCVTESSQGTAGANAWETGVIGEANHRLIITARGIMNWGPGGGSNQDTTLYRASAALIACDTLAWNNGGTAEVWQTLTLASGWTGTLRIKRTVDGMIRLTSTGLTPGTKADGTTVFTLPAGYRPAFSTDVCVVVNSLGGATAQSPHFAIATNGVTTCWGFANATGANVNEAFPID